MLYPRENRFRAKKVIDGMWSVRLDRDGNGMEQRWHETRFDYDYLIPPCTSFNDLVTDGNDRDFAGDFWYRQDFFLPLEWEDKNVVLRFGSVTFNCDVWINGRHIGGNKGGYLPFEFTINDTADFGSPNQLTLRIDKRHDFTTIPPGITYKTPGGNEKVVGFYDFFPYVGIHRPVTLYTTSREHIEGITVSTDIDGADGVVKYEVTTFGSKQTSVQLIDPDGNVVAAAEGASGVMSVKDAHFWGPGDGYLYDLKVGYGDVDEYIEPIGIRTVAVTDKEILINGKPVYLTGYGRHEDNTTIGKGHSSAHMVRDFELMKWQGANSFRTSHYPYAEEVYYMADRMGMLIIDETPAVGLMVSRNSMFAMMFRAPGLPELPASTFGPDALGEESSAELDRVIERLIERDKNHPSVIMWSVANEPDAHSEGSGDYFGRAIDTVRRLDPTRPVTVVEHMGYKPDESTVADKVDVICLNRYFGWYVGTGDIDGTMPMMKMELEATYKLNPKPVIYTEFGADTVEGNHSLPAQAWSEEYQQEYYEKNCAVLDSCDFVAGEHVWNFADFMTTQGIMRVRGNRKGVFTRDRQPKTVAHSLRKRWLKISEGS